MNYITIPFQAKLGRDWYENQKESEWETGCNGGCSIKKVRLLIESSTTSPHLRIVKGQILFGSGASTQCFIKSNFTLYSFEPVGYTDQT